MNGSQCLLVLMLYRISALEMLKWWLLKQGKKVRGGWMREATGGGGAMCGRGGGWICLLCYLIQAASHTNTICHHSHLKSAACTGLLGTAGYWLLQEGVRSPPSACGLHRSHGVCVTSRSGGGGVGPVICRAASAALWWFSARGEEQGGCRGGRDQTDRNTVMRWHMADCTACTLWLRLPLFIHRGTAEAGHWDAERCCWESEGCCNRRAGSSTDKQALRRPRTIHCWLDSLLTILPLS